MCVCDHTKAVFLKNMIVRWMSHVLSISASIVASGQDHWPGLGEEGPRTLHRGAEPLRPRIQQ